MRRIPLIIAIALVAFLTTPTFGGNWTSRSEIGIDYGAIDFDSNVSRNTGDRVAVRGGYNFNEHFLLEAQIGRSLSNGVFSDDLKADLDTYMVNGVYSFLTKGVARPYALVGVGRANLDVDVPSFRFRGRRVGGFSVDDGSTAYQLAAGSRFRLGKSELTMLRAEVSLLREDTFNEDSTHATFQAGLSWRLGKKG